ncbi:hypothetical protein V5799_013323, partial [Amblyomma americanum]
MVLMMMMIMDFYGASASLAKERHGTRYFRFLKVPGGTGDRIPHLLHARRMLNHLATAAVLRAWEQSI